MRQVVSRLVVLVCAALALSAMPGQQAWPQTAERPASDADVLEQMARKTFGDLTRAEVNLLRTAPSSDIAWGGPIQDPDDRANDPAKADRWGKERTIRAPLLRWLYLDADAVKRINPSGVGVAAARIDGPLDFSYCILGQPLTLLRCSIQDGINLTVAQTRGLDFRRCRTGPIAAARAVIHGDLTLNRGAYGPVDLFRAQLEGDLDCSRGHFLTGERDAISAIEAVITGDVLFHDGFVTDGMVDLRLAKIGGALSFNKAEFTGGRRSGLDAERATVDGGLYWTEIKLTPRTELDLANARAGTLWDDEKSWPAAGNLMLEGFVYGGFTGGPMDAASRLRWLHRQPPEYRPQPYSQLAKVLRESGRQEAATSVLVARGDALREYGHLRLADRVWQLMLKLTIAYGYRPLQALWWIVSFVVAGTLLFQWGFSAGVVTPTDADAAESFARNGSLPIHYPLFNGFIYSLEKFLPLVDLHQGTHWWPNPQHRLRQPLRILSHEFDPGRLPGEILRWYLWVHILAGWVLTPLFLAGLSGLVRND